MALGALGPQGPLVGRLVLYEAMVPRPNPGVDQVRPWATLCSYPTGSGSFQGTP